MGIVRSYGAFSQAIHKSRPIRCNTTILKHYHALHLHK
jgi:hypothetical protein